MKFRFRTPHHLPESWAADRHAVPADVWSQALGLNESEPLDRYAATPASSAAAARAFPGQGTVAVGAPAANDAVLGPR